MTQQGKKDAEKIMEHVNQTGVKRTVSFVMVIRLGLPADAASTGTLVFHYLEL